MNDESPAHPAPNKGKRASVAAKTDSSSSDSSGSEGESNSGPVPYLYISTFFDTRKHSAGRSPRASIAKTKSLRSTSNPSLPKLPGAKSDKAAQPIEFNENGEKWILRCVCDVKSGEGYLVCCDKCGVWQHGICYNVNPHTVPEKYLCEICSNKKIRCKCGNNSNYRFMLIQCTQCQYYVHRRCEGLGYGPLPSGKFVCHQCGKPHFDTNIVRFPPGTSFEKEFDETFIDKLSPHLLVGPLGVFLNETVLPKKLPAVEFFELLYSYYKSFLFISHPLLNTPLSKKKRQNLYNSFLYAVQYLGQHLYNIPDSVVIDVLDAIIFTDLYTLPVATPAIIESGSELTENARFEIPNITNEVKFSTMPVGPQLTSNGGGVVSLSDIGPDQFIAFTEGLIGDLEEFNYDPSVNAAYYQITGTRLVLDATRIALSPLHHMRRSLIPNVLLKIVQLGDSHYCALFAGKSPISCGTPLRLGIDFIPAVISDISKWFSWHFDETLATRPISQVPSIEDLKKEKEKKKLKKQKIDKRRGRKPKMKLKKNGFQGDSELTLFGLFDCESPGDYLIRLSNGELEEEEPYEVKKNRGPKKSKDAKHDDEDDSDDRQKSESDDEPDLIEFIQNDEEIYKKKIPFSSLTLIDPIKEMLRILS